MNRFSGVLALTALLLGGCASGAQRPAAAPARTVDPEVHALRIQLAAMRAERDAALAQLRAMMRQKPQVVRVVVPAPVAVSPHRPANDESQAGARVFTTLSTQP
jgi:outer membrane murein-binding lipoprotein Lpp